jgi:transcription elongation factor Elf1
MPEIIVVCSNCGKELEIEKSGLTKGSYPYPDFQIEVNQCKGCSEDALEKRYQEGLADGRET